MNSSKLLANRGRRWLIWSVAVVTLMLLVSLAAQEKRDAGAPAVNPKAAAVKGFLDRVNEYVGLQKKVDNGLPKLSGDDDPSKIEAHQAAMAARIKMARASAKRGDIFGSAPANRAMDSLTERVGNARTSSRLAVTRPAGLVVGTAASATPVRANTFFGDSR